MKTSLGIDYAGVDNPDPPSLTKSKKAGLEFAILRATYGITADKIFQRDWSKLKDAGLMRGAYMFPVCSKTRDPEPQVKAFAAAVQKAGGLLPGVDLPPVLDVEFPKGIKATGMSRMECLDWVHRALMALEDEFKVLPIIYTSARVWDGQDEDSLDASRVPMPVVDDCPLWLARYPYKTRIVSHHLPEERDGLTVPAVPVELGDASDVWFHQYQGDAVDFPGFSSWVDLNRFFPISQATAGPGSTKVKWVQRKLKVSVDGVWGDLTERALREFQSLRQIPGTGVVDLRTFAALSWI